MDIIEAKIKKLFEENNIAGMSVAITDRDRVVKNYKFGLMDIEEPALGMADDPLYRIASITKVVSGLTVLRLVDGGVLELDRPVKHPGFLLPHKGHRCQIPKRRTLLHLPKFNFQGIKAIVILCCRKGDHLVLRNSRLNHGSARGVSPARPAHHLGQHIEGGLRGTEAVGIET